MKTKIYVAFISNDRVVPNNEPLIKFLEKEGFEPEIGRFHTNAELKYTEFKKDLYGLKDIKVQLAEHILPGEWNLIMFFYKPNTDKPLAAWTRGMPFYRGEKSVFVEVPQSSVWGSWNYQAPIHEVVHALHRFAWWNGVTTKDTMDEYPDVLGGLEENIERLRIYLPFIVRQPKKIGILLKMVQILAKILGLQKQIIYTGPMIPTGQQENTDGGKLEEWAEAIKQFEGWSPGSVSFRNNNPGNIKGLDGRFISFSTYEEGWNHLLDYLKRAATGKHAAYKPDMTLLDFFKVYAPASDNNHPVNYARFVANKVGVSMNQKIKTLV